MEKVKCDCLNYCGDDPWLKDGRAEHCERWKKNHEEASFKEKESEELTALVGRMKRLASLGLEHVNVKSSDLLFLCKHLE